MRWRQYNKGLKMTAVINQKIWSMATVLWHDGVSNSDYLEQLTYLLFLKMADEYSKPPYNRQLGLPIDCQWDTLKNKTGAELATQYKYILDTLAGRPGTLQEIYADSSNKIKTPAVLARIVQMIGAENWTSMSSDVKGDIYEGLLAKISEDTKSGAGQYFTPRPLINTIVKCVRPEPNKTIADPCCGSGGFLLSSKEFIETNYQLDAEQKKFLKFKAFHGWEVVQNTYRLCLMNLFLHNIGDFNNAPPITRNDALLSDPGTRYDYVLTNPPFGNKSSFTFTNERGEQETEDMVYNRQDFWITSSNKQINFVQHICTILKIGGTAAVVVPDNVLFEGGGAETVRKKLLETIDFHTILRLPTGIFYKPGVKANVIFFENRAASKEKQTKEVWIYDFRTNKHFTLKKNPLKSTDLDDFISCYNPENRYVRKETERFRKFSYADIAARDKTSLDITWLKPENDMEDCTLSELLKEIKGKTENIVAAVSTLEDLIGKIEE